MLGRFLQRDPSGYQDGINLYAFEDSVGKPSSSSLMNAYLYCENNPVNYVDPSGLWSVKLGKWGLPLEIQLDNDPGEGVAARALGPFAILYGSSYRAQNTAVQESIRYHEYVHVGQWGWGIRDIWDKALHKPYPTREMEAYVMERQFIQQKLKSKCLNASSRDAVGKEKEDLDFMIDNPQNMWSW